jgi:hypothetical protein
MRLFRIEPVLPAEDMKTFQIAAPLPTHWRPATCAETDCLAYLHGWQTSVDEATDLGQRQAHYIRHDRSRRHTERRAETGLTVFGFEPGQTCFTPHRLPSGRPERFLVTGGDWRGNPRGVPLREHTRPDFWVEEMAGNLDDIRTAKQKG